MNNFVQEGEVLTVPAPYDVASGAACKVGLIVGVATFAATTGKPVNIKRRGVFKQVGKATGQAWVALTTKLYWDDAAKVFTSTASSNTLAGVAAADAASGDAIGSVLLTGQIA